MKKIHCSVGFTIHFYLRLFISVLLNSAGLHARGGKVGCSRLSEAVPQLRAEGRGGGVCARSTYIVGTGHLWSVINCKI